MKDIHDSAIFPYFIKQLFSTWSSSGELKGTGAVQPQGGVCIPMPLKVHAAFAKQNYTYTCLASAHDTWEMADMMVYKEKHKGECENYLAEPKNPKKKNIYIINRYLHGELWVPSSNE